MSTAMTNWWQSPAGCERGSEWASDFSIPPSRFVRTEIPVGTVASRIIDLQNLARSSRYNGPQTAASCRRERSRTGFRQQTDTRYGQSASRSSQPDEHLELDVQHTFLARAAQRNNHMEEHATVDRRTSVDRTSTSGLHAQLMASGRSAGVQNEVPSPWDLLPNSHSKEDVIRHDEGRPNDVDDSATRLDDSIPNSVLSRPSADGAAENDAATSHHEPEQTTDHGARPGNPRQRRLEPHSETISAETTSTMRRQSVRDLYAYYGIRRPPGLVSSENFAGSSENVNQSPEKYICCHMCFRINSLKSAYCKCGHEICAACEGIFSDAGSRNSWSVEGTGSMQRSRSGYPEKAASKILPEPKTKIGDTSQGNLPHRHSHGEVMRDDKTFHDPTSLPKHVPLGSIGGVPKLRVEGTRLHGSGKHATACREVFDTMTQNQGSSRTLDEPNLITASTLLSTDALLPGYSLGLLPVVMSTGSQPEQSGRCPHHLSTSERLKSQFSPLPDVGTKGGYHDCKIQCYKGKQLGQARYRESTCPRKRRRRPDETDSGYAAGISHLDERIAMGHEKYSAEEDLRQSYHNHSEAKSLTQDTKAATAPITEIKRLKHVRSDYLQHSGTYSLGGSPAVPKHADIDMLPEDGKVRKGSSPLPSGSIRPRQNQNQCLHNLSQCTHYDGRCYGHGDYQSFSSSHTVRQDQYTDSLRMAPQTQSLTSSSETSLSSDTTDDKNRPITTPISQKSKNELLQTTKVAPAEPRDDPAHKTSLAHKQQFSKEAFMTLKRKFENEEPELEAARLSKIAPPYSTNHADPSPEPKNRPILPKDRPSYESRSSVSNHPSGACSSHKHKSTSRRLSAFFKLQEQNIVSTLNKRLQEHQEELKRMESLCADQLNLASRMNAPILEEGTRNEGQKMTEEQLVGSDKELADKLEDCTPSRPEQRMTQDDKVQEDHRETNRNEKGQEVMLLGLDTPKIIVETHWDGEHRHKWKRMVVQSAARTVDSSGRFQEERYVGVNGITITIHMDGREDIVIKADLSG